jgi:hypothetical protein
MDTILLISTTLSVLLAMAFSMYACLTVMEEHFGALYTRIKDLEAELSKLQYEASEDEKED